MKQRLRARPIPTLGIALLLLTGMLALPALFLTVPTHAGGGSSMRLYGTDRNDLGRVKIAIDAPDRPADVGGNFTIEFWMKAESGTNTTSACSEGGVNWINGNIILDRDIFGSGDYGDYGVSLAGGRIAFGVANGNGEATICSNADLRNGVWHHVALTRSSASGTLRIYIDGVQKRSASGPTGDVSYRDGRSTSYPASDPFLVIGAEKHSLPNYPGYNGLIDELRISNSVRYTSGFTPPSAPFTTDGNTVALYHFDEGGGTVLNDSSGASGGPSHGEIKYAGATARPSWSADQPWGNVSSPTSEPPTSDIPPTNTPELLLTATVLPERNYLPLVQQ